MPRVQAGVWVNRWGGRRIQWAWMLPGAALVCAALFAGDLWRFATTVRLYGGSAWRVWSVESQLRQTVAPALERREPKAALAALDAIEAEFPEQEHLLLPPRIDAWLQRDDIPAALALYRRYRAWAPDTELPRYVRDVLEPYLQREADRTVVASTRFSDVTQAVGAAFTHRQRGEHGLAGLYQAMGPGLALLDLDGDGWLDLLFLGGMEHPGDGEGNRLLRNRGDGTFEDMTAGSGLAWTGFTFGVSAADLDGDDLPEIFITARGRNYLFRNRGAMRFEDATESAGLLGPGGLSTAAAFGDMDADGDLDLYVGRWVRMHAREDRILDLALGERGKLSLFAPHMYEPETNVLYRNEGGLRFTDVTRDSGVQDETGRTLGVVFQDLDRDGFADLFVANDESPNRLFLGRGDGTFVDHSASARMYDARASMGTAVADFDHDGWLDLVYTNFRTEYNVLALNRLQQGFFSEQTEEVGLADGSLGVTSWGVVAADVDNDGDADLAIVNGHPTPYDPDVTAFRGAPLPGEGCLPEAPLLYERRGDDFVDVSASSGAFGASRAVGRGLVAGDIDRDGRIDLVQASNNGRSYVFRNEGGSGGRWLVVRLRGPSSNRSAVGAVITVTAGASVESAVLLAGGSYLSQNPFEAHFGLGPAEVATVQVRWPDGAESEHTGSANQVLEVQHPGGPVGVRGIARRERVL